MPASLSRSDKALLDKYSTSTAPSLGRTLCYVSTAIWVLLTSFYPFVASKGLSVWSYIRDPLTAVGDELTLPLPGKLLGSRDSMVDVPLTPFVLLVVFTVSTFALTKAYHNQALTQESRHVLSHCLLVLLSILTSMIDLH